MKKIQQRPMTQIKYELQQIMTSDNNMNGIHEY